MSEKGRVILPVNYPPITSWQWHASLFSILYDDELALNWIFSNYIQLRCYPDMDQISDSSILFTDFMPGDSSLLECPYLLTQIITHKQILAYSNNLLEFLIKSIDLSYYIFGICDETDMLNKGIRIMHQLFIYGYDLEKEVFYVGDFTFDNGRYSYTTVSFDKVVYGFLNVQSGEDFVFDHNYKDMNGLYLISKNTYKKYYEFDPQLVKRSLNEYLSSCDTKKHFRQSRNHNNTNIFGINTYDAIIHELSLLEEKINTWFDYRPFHVFYDHKVLMENRIKYMMDKKYIPFNQEILNKYNEVRETALKARNGFLKALIKKDVRILAAIKSYLLNTREEEINVLSSIEGML
jgi:hypothetical protein